MKLLLVVIALAALGGCATLSDTHARYLESKCAIYGLELGSEAHATCFSHESQEWQQKTWGDL
jgi:hypothetical protein